MNEMIIHWNEMYSELKYMMAHYHLQMTRYFFHTLMMIYREYYIAQHYKAVWNENITTEMYSNSI